MKIEEVITETIIAIYQAPIVASNLRLKGGSAMRLFDNLTSRLSTDVDFSISSDIEDEKAFFGAIKSTVGERFQKSRFDVIDFKWGRKPERRRAGLPAWWGGWQCEFKLVAFEHRGKPIETKRRNAMVPEGVSSSKIMVEISGHEYCGKRRIKTIKGVRIFGYTRELLVVEKLRAICQQHPEYAYRLSKNRARDFYDIYELTSDADDNFAHRCRSDIEKVFQAKEVPLSILSALWDNAFIDEQRSGFNEVRDTVSSNIHEFDVYVEHLRFLVKEIYPTAV